MKFLLELEDVKKHIESVSKYNNNVIENGASTYVLPEYSLDDVTFGDGDGFELMVDTKITYDPFDVIKGNFSLGVIRPQNADKIESLIDGDNGFIELFVEAYNKELDKLKIKI